MIAKANMLSNKEIGIKIGELLVNGQLTIQVIP
jgi:hypothetical protein